MGNRLVCGSCCTVSSSSRPSSSPSSSSSSPSSSSVICYCGQIVSRPRPRLILSEIVASVVRGTFNNPGYPLPDQNNPNIELGRYRDLEYIGFDQFNGTYEFEIQEPVNCSDPYSFTPFDTYRYNPTITRVYTGKINGDESDPAYYADNGWWLEFQWINPFQVTIISTLPTGRIPNFGAGTLYSGMNLVFGSLASALTLSCPLQNETRYDVIGWRYGTNPNCPTPNTGPPWCMHPGHYQFRGDFVYT